MNCDNVPGLDSAVELDELLVAEVAVVVAVVALDECERLRRTEGQLGLQHLVRLGRAHQPVAVLIELQELEAHLRLPARETHPACQTWQALYTVR